MSRRYRISPEGRPPLTDAEVARHADAERLLYNYHKAVKPLYKRPLYKDPRTFIALLILVLLAILIGEVVDDGPPAVNDVPERHAP
jgi:hypothetical protein